jgi:hypothetical protein
VLDDPHLADDRGRGDKALDQWGEVRTPEAMAEMRTLCLVIEQYCIHRPFLDLSGSRTEISPKEVDGGLYGFPTNYKYWASRRGIRVQ